MQEQTDKQEKQVNIKINQVPVFTPTKKLKAIWTVEAEQDLKAFCGIRTTYSCSIISGKSKFNIPKRKYGRLTDRNSGVKYHTKSKFFGVWTPATIFVKRNEE